MKRKFSVKTLLKQKPGIYRISCNKSDKVYVGESVNISARILKHFSFLRHNRHSNPILQNMFNKYGEETFSVEVLEYTTFSNELELKRLELEYLSKEANCISMDSNEIFQVERSDEWKQKQGNRFDKYREEMLDKFIRKPIVVYDIINKTSIEFKQITDAEKLIERKHIAKNISEKVLIPYKHLYVAFLKEEFTQDNIDRIITIKSDNIKYGAVRNLCTLYNLYSGEIKYFASKSQFSLYFSDSTNDKLYDRYLNNHLLDFNFRCVVNPKDKKELFSMNIYIRNTSRSKKCNLKVWYDSLLKCKTNTSIAETCRIDRKIIGLAFKERSKIEWIRMLDKIISELPD